jgi:hypothetical protein
MYVGVLFSVPVFLDCSLDLFPRYDSPGLETVSWIRPPRFNRAQVSKTSLGIYNKSDSRPLIIIDPTIGSLMFQESGPHGGNTPRLHQSPLRLTNERFFFYFATLLLIILFFCVALIDTDPRVTATLRRVFPFIHTVRLWIFPSGEKIFRSLPHPTWITCSDLALLPAAWPPAAWILLS